MRVIFYSLLCSIFLIGNVFANTPEEGEETGANLPRMVSLRSNHINARSGPGARYPIEWVYMQKGAPVEIIAEFELWRKIRDWEGSESWVHKSMLSGKRSVKVVAKGENNLYDKADYNSRVVARVEDEVIGEVVKCPSGVEMCFIKFPVIDGWITKKALFGVYAKEEI